MYGRDAARVPDLQPPPSLVKRQRPQIVAAVLEQVIEPHPGGKIAELARCRDLAVQALLQIVEGRHRTIAHDQQLAVEHDAVGQYRQDFGKRRPDIIARARVEPPAPSRDELDADAVPFPFGAIIGRIETAEIVFFRPPGRASAA